MYRYKGPIQPTTPPSNNLQPRRILQKKSITEAARDSISSDSYLLERTVPESEKGSHIYADSEYIQANIEFAHWGLYTPQI